MFHSVLFIIEIIDIYYIHAHLTTKNISETVGTIIVISTLFQGTL